MGVGHLVRNVSELTDPRALPNLECWYDSRYPNGIGSAMPFDGDQLSTWTDLSGNGKHLSQATASKRPVWKSSGTNPVPKFSSSRWYINSSHTVEGTDVLNTNAATNTTSYVTIAVPTSYVPSQFKITGEACASGLGTAGTAQRYFGTAYLAADGSTQVANSSGYTSNGNAPPLTYSDGVTWESTSWSYNLGNSAIKYLRIFVGCYNSTPVKIRSMWVTFYNPNTSSWQDAAYVEPVTLAGGMPIVKFDGVDDVLQTTTHPITTGDVSIYTVRNDAVQHATAYQAPYFCRQEGNTLAGDQTINDTYGFNSYVVPTSASTSGKETSYWGGNGVDANSWTTAPTAIKRDVPIVSSHIIPNGGQLQVAVSGVSLSTPTKPCVANVSNIPFWAGYYNWEGNMSCILLFRQAHDNVTRNKVERMLSRWFGVTLG